MGGWWGGSRMGCGGGAGARGRRGVRVGWGWGVVVLYDGSLLSSYNICQTVEDGCHS